MENQQNPLKWRPFSVNIPFSDGPMLKRQADKLILIKEWADKSGIELTATIQFIYSQQPETMMAFFVNNPV